MIFSTSEIKVALLGNVSAGKTTVLNALFRDKYGEVSMKRTTAGVNYFRIVTPGRSPASSEEKQSEGSTEVKEEQWYPSAEDPRTAESTLEEITKDNIALRESNRVQEKWFDIELTEHLVEMRKDTHLVVVDVPGINEAGACSKYKDYVNAKWSTFDCVIAVMDGKQGVNTEDQVYLLNLIRHNIINQREIPVIILFNKVDDPEDQEQAELIREAKEEINRIFTTVPSTSGRQPLFGSQTQSHPFGAPASSPFGAPAPSSFGSPAEKVKSNVFGSPAPSGFRALEPAFGSQAQSSPFSFGTQVQSNNTFGAPAPTDAFSNFSFGAPAPAPFGSQAKPDPFGASVSAGGTSSMPFYASRRQDGTETVAMQSISAMQHYQNKSFEELRYEDYKQQNPPQPEIKRPAMSGYSGGFNTGSPAEKPTKRSSTKSPRSGSTEFLHWPEYLSFITVSAMSAFIHQSASKMSMDQFKRFFDKELIEKTGRYQIGQRRWSKLSEEERIVETFAIISDPNMHLEALQESNFHKFLSVFRYQIGGEECQRQLLEKQIHFSMATLKTGHLASVHASSSLKISEHVQQAFMKMQALSEDEVSLQTIQELKEAFWQAYGAEKNKSMASFMREGPKSIKLFTVLMDELLAFYYLSVELKWGDMILITDKMKSLIRGLIFELYERYDSNPVSAKPVFNPPFSNPWQLTFLAWSRIWGSISLMSYSKHFCGAFGSEKLMIDTFLLRCQQEWQNSVKNCITLKEQVALKFDVETERLVPVRPEEYHKVIPFDLPESLSDPNHFGHIVFVWCELIESISRKSKNQN